MLKWRASGRKYPHAGIAARPIVMPATLEPPPPETLARYADEFVAARWEALGNAGGFSGAQFWRGTTAEGQRFCLRAWPAGRITGTHIAVIHRFMGQAAWKGLPFIPTLELTRSCETWLNLGGRFWELTDWLPGRADFRDNPTDARLAAAVGAVAQIHAAWAPSSPKTVPCPAIQRRLQAIQDWEGLLSSGWRPVWGSAGESDQVRELAQRLWSLLPVRLRPAMADLVRCKDRPLPVQPCLCDVWHDHILFEGDSVTGVIDFAQVKYDCVAVDLARLLGSMVPDNDERLHGALWEYGRVRPLPSGSAELVPLLDRTGVLVGAMNWLRWIYHEKRPFPDQPAVAWRLGELARRLGA
jgi:Ser/Thr protein kinase RdoA (MazF antagonist)